MTVKLLVVPAVVDEGKPLTTRLLTCDCGMAGQLRSLINTETLFVPELAVTTSTQPSPLKSPAATAVPMGSAELIGGEKVPSPLLRSTVSKLLSGVTTSSLLSL